MLHSDNGKIRNSLKTKTEITNDNKEKSITLHKARFSELMRTLAEQHQRKACKKNR